MKQRIISIQVIRAAAFLLIFLSHVGIVSTGPIGVSLFLVLSGFCMTYSYLDRPERLPPSGLSSQIRFAAKKVSKLYPLHLCTLLAVALAIFGGLLLSRASLREIAEQGGYFVANALLLQSWIPWRDGYFSFNAVSWYLSTVAFSYFLFPLVFHAIQSRQPRRIAALGAAVLAAMIAISTVLSIGRSAWDWSAGFVKWVVYISPLYRTGDFIIGLILGVWFLDRKHPPGRSTCTALELGLIVIMAMQVVAYCSESLPTSWSLTLFWLPTSAALIFIFSLQNGAVSRFLSGSKVIVWLGDISGEAFLIHQICIKGVGFFVNNKFLLAGISLAATLICTVIWRYLYQSIRKNRSVRTSI